MFSGILLAQSSLAAYGPAQGCEAALNDWCNYPDHCSLANEHVLFARHSLGYKDVAQKWRCYARFALSYDGQEYATPDKTYCTRDEQLTAELNR